MSDDQSTTDETTTDESTEGQPAGTPPEGAPSGDASQTGDEPKGDEPKLSHEDALKALADTRREAANYRTRLREAEDKLKAAKTPEEYEAAVSELSSRNAELERSIIVNEVATKYKLPAELREVLTGATEAELEAHAQKLAKFAPTEEEPPAELGGGLTPGGNDPDEGLSPRELARKYGKQRR